MKKVILPFLFAVIIEIASSQDCFSVEQQSVVDNSRVEVFGPNEPVCIRCLDPGNSFMLFDPVEYLDSGGNLIINNTNNIVITDDGLLLKDPFNSFNDGDSVFCRVAGTSNEYEITIGIIALTPPTITPAGGLQTYTEGDTVTLTCSGDIAGVNDRYQWTLPDGTVSPANPSQSGSPGLTLVFNNINRTESGIYTCTVSVTGVEVTNTTNVTLNIQFAAKVLSFTPDNSTVTVNSTLTLNCTFEGNPSPNVLWYHNGSELTNTENDPNLSETIDVYTSSALLNVTFTNINISGVYACSPNNTVANVVSTPTFVTVQVAPGPVATLQNDSVTDECITLSWSFGFDGNSPITGVDITYNATDNYSPSHSDSTSTNNRDQTAINICDLQPYTTYEFSVSVRNEVSDTVGLSSSETVSADTLPLAPDAPTLDSVGPINSTVLSVSWTPIINTFTQSPLTGYTIQYKVYGSSDTESITITDPTQITVNIPDLLKGTEYEFQLLSTNSAGNSPLSNMMSARTDIDPPSEVIGLAATENPFSVCVSWFPPIDNGGQDIVGYRVDLWNRDQYEMENFMFVMSLSEMQLTYTIENLDNDTEYYIRVAASNAANSEGGIGDNRTVNATTGRPLQVDPNFKVEIYELTAISVEINWTLLDNGNSNTFRLQYKETGEDFNPDMFLEYDNSVRSALINTLNPNTTYDLRLTRIEGEGCIRRVSETIYIETLELDVVIPSLPNVTSGEQVVMSCLLSTGGPAPDVTWMRVTGGDIPADAMISGHMLTIPDSQVEDSGDYTCISRAGTQDEAMFTFSLLVQEPPPTIPPSETPSPTALETPSQEPKETDDSLPVWVIPVVAVGAFACIVFFVVVLIILIFCCYHRHEKSEKTGGRYDLAKITGKSSSSGMWVDEGASSFAPIKIDHDDAPVTRGRTMTNDYTTAISFNTLEKADDNGKTGLLPVKEERQTDV